MPRACFLRLSHEMACWNASLNFTTNCPMGHSSVTYMPLICERKVACQYTIAEILHHFGCMKPWNHGLPANPPTWFAAIQPPAFGLLASFRIAKITYLCAKRFWNVLNILKAISGTSLFWYIFIHIRFNDLHLWIVLLWFPTQMCRGNFLLETCRHYHHHYHHHYVPWPPLNRLGQGVEMVYVSTIGILKNWMVFQE